MQIRWETEAAGSYACCCGKGSGTNYGQQFLTQEKLETVSAAARVVSVSHNVSRIVLTGRWCDIVLNVQFETEYKVLWGITTGIRPVPKVPQEKAVRGFQWKISEIRYFTTDSSEQESTWKQTITVLECLTLPGAQCPHIETFINTFGSLLIGSFTVTLTTSFR